MPEAKAKVALHIHHIRLELCQMLSNGSMRRRIAEPVLYFIRKRCADMVELESYCLRTFIALTCGTKSGVGKANNYMAHIDVA